MKFLSTLLSTLVLSLALAGAAMAGETVNINTADAATLDRVLINFGTLGQPGLHRGVLLVCQPGYGQWHALFGMVLSVSVELTRCRADILAIEAKDDFCRQFGIGGQRRTVAQLKHASHQGSLGTAFHGEQHGGHGNESFS